MKQIGVLSPKWETDGFLAPRGVFYGGDTLAVSDTGHNRVFVWKNFSSFENRQPDIVLGRGAHGLFGGSVQMADASSLHYPSGIWTDGQRLIVADSWNHRVLVWHTLPNRDSQPADLVIGQKDFFETTPNRKGLNATPSADSLYWPYGVYSNGKSLWIADTGNRRVLYYERIPDQSGIEADVVIGQESFSERELHPEFFTWPYSVKISEQGEMLVADTQYFRTLYWKNWESSVVENAIYDHQKMGVADVVLGQMNLTDSGQNRFRLSPDAGTINWCYDACFFDKGLAVADTGNSRILIWNRIPDVHGKSADKLLGQSGFEVNGESGLLVHSRAQVEMYWPFAVCRGIEDSLVVADTGNHRILFYR